MKNLKFVAAVGCVDVWDYRLIHLFVKNVGNLYLRVAPSDRLNPLNEMEADKGMKDTDYLRELAKAAKKAGKQKLVLMYCNNYKRLKRKEKALTVSAANA